LIQERIGANSQVIPLTFVRSGWETLKKHLVNSTAQYLIPDAEDEDDLRTISMAIQSSAILPCGASGFGQAWAETVFGPRKSIKLEKGNLRGPTLFVIGSIHPNTREQADRLIALGIDTMIVHADKPSELERFLTGVTPSNPILLKTPDTRIDDRIIKNMTNEALAKSTQVILQTLPINSLFICGGETAGEIIQALETKTVKIFGELLPGIPYGKLVGGTGDGIFLITKAGGFGNKDSLLHLYEIQ